MRGVEEGRVFVDDYLSIQMISFECIFILICCVDFLLQVLFIFWFSTSD